MRQHLSLFVYSVLVILMMAPTVEATETEIAYDEGEPDWYFAQGVPGDYLAVRFSVPTPPGLPATLVRARFYLRNSDTSTPWPFSVIVFGSDGIIELRRITVLAPAASSGWYDVAFTPPLLVFDDFFIAMEWTTEPTDQVSLWVDRPTRVARSYFGPPMTQDSDPWLTTELMIRAVVEDVEGAPIPTVTEWGLAVLVMLLAATGAVVLHRRRFAT